MCNFLMNSKEMENGAVEVEVKDSGDEGMEGDLDSGEEGMERDLDSGEYSVEVDSVEVDSEEVDLVVPGGGGEIGPSGGK